MNRNSIDELARRLAETVPEGVRAAGADLEKNFRSLLQSGFSRMELVTREEFDVQAAVLARTREKLEALEARVAELELERERDSGPDAPPPLTADRDG
jgi:ubiquinone biosynthesis accessory factor UbiK